VGWEGVLPENGGQRADRSVAPMMHATERAMPAPGCDRPEQLRAELYLSGRQPPGPSGNLLTLKNSPARP